MTASQCSFPVLPAVIISVFIVADGFPDKRCHHWLFHPLPSDLLFPVFVVCREAGRRREHPLPVCFIPVS